jgi:hypothetical protein
VKSSTVSSFRLNHSHRYPGNPESERRPELKQHSSQTSHPIFYLVANAATGAIFSIMQVANSLVFTLVAPGIRRSKSYVTFFC